jgi:hypothetical protein
MREGCMREGCMREGCMRGMYERKEVKERRKRVDVRVIS